MDGLPGNGVSDLCDSEKDPSSDSGSDPLRSAILGMLELRIALPLATLAISVERTPSSFTLLLPV